jgi:type IV fimbrial biogenesis protein FimT
VLKDHLYRGFTLVELMVVIALLAMFMLYAVPSMSDYMTNSKIRNSAQALQAGLMKARAEAIRTNRPIQFFTTNASPPLLGSAANATGSNWVIADRTRPPLQGGPALVESRDGREGSTTQVTQTTTQDTITFNPIGGTDLIGNAVFNFSHPRTTCAAGSALRCVSVVVNPSGRVHLCDPLITVVTDPRRCT